jgi:two-component system chemotaxis response regulator CheB
VVASAGGVEALSKLVSMLPPDLPATVLVVLHISPVGPSVLPRILSRVGKLPARHPRDGEPLEGGVITVAPPDLHLAVDDGRIRLLATPRENGHRPAADVLLRSVAREFGPRCAGIVLSGTLDDGAAGLRAIRAAGGLALVQDPEEAPFPGMPLAAIDEASPQFVGPVPSLAEHLLGWLDRLPAGLTVLGAADPPETLEESEQPTELTCPECGGTLYEHDSYGAERLRCRVGHTFSLDGLALGKREVLEKALWAAVVALDEQADLARRMIKRLSASGRHSQIERYHDQIAVIEQRSTVLLRLIHELVEHSADGETEANGGGAASQR